MAQNLTIAGNQYPAVPSILIPKTGENENAIYVDPSVTTAIASDVKVGKYFLDVNGDLTEGTSSGGAVVITDETDAHGGTIRTITAITIYDGDNLLYGGQYSSIVGEAYTGQSYTVSDVAMAGISKAGMSIVYGDTAIVGTALVDGMVAG